VSKYGWKASLEKGVQGELKLVEMWPELTRLAGKAADFLLPDGTAVELKTDSYDMNETSNYFIERYSDVDKGKIGGPWQAFGRGATLFAYMYSKNAVVHVFKTTDVMKAVEAMEKAGTLKPVQIHNRSHVTVGYKVPRVALEHLLLKVLQDD
jgi:hypothetical protein